MAQAGRVTGAVSVACLVCALALAGLAGWMILERVGHKLIMGLKAPGHATYPLISGDSLVLAVPYFLLATGAAALAWDPTRARAVRKLSLAFLAVEALSILGMALAYGLR